MCVVYACTRCQALTFPPTYPPTSPRTSTNPTTSTQHALASVGEVEAAERAQRVLAAQQLAAQQQQAARDSQQSKEAARAEWSDEEVRLLQKAINKFPVVGVFGGGVGDMGWVMWGVARFQWWVWLGGLGDVGGCRVPMVGVMGVHSCTHLFLCSSVHTIAHASLPYAYNPPLASIHPLHYTLHTHPHTPHPHTPHAHTPHPHTPHPHTGYCQALGTSSSLCAHPHSRRSARHGQARTPDHPHCGGCWQRNLAAEHQKGPPYDCGGP